MALRKVQLREVAHARSGDKANLVNIGVIANKSEDYQLILETVTTEKVKEHFGWYVEGEVVRYEMPNIKAVNFVLHKALNGGAANSLRSDTLGKCFASALLRMEIEVDENILQ
jgi:hypothetical protein